MGYPVALKVDSPDILAQDRGRRRAAGPARRGRGARRFRSRSWRTPRIFAPNAAIDGALVQEMVTGGIEIIVGVKYDRAARPDAAVRQRRRDGRGLQRRRAAALPRHPVRSARHDGGGQRREAAAAASAASRRPTSTRWRTRSCASRTWPCTSRDSLAELDINPLMVLPAGQGVKAVDALVVLQR